MNQRQFRAVGLRLLTQLPGFALDRSLVFRRPVHRVLQGLCFEGSSDASIFYFWFFVLPLSIPTGHIYFSFGDRLRTQENSQRWSANVSDRLVEELLWAIQTQALPLISEVRSVREMRMRLAQWGRDDRPELSEALAHSFIREGDIASASQEIRRVVEKLNPRYADNEVIRLRVERLNEVLRTDLASARLMIASWEEETVRNLKLTKYWVGEISK